MNEPWILGINGGGTRTTARAVCAGEAIEGILASSGPSNLRRVGLEVAAGNVVAAATDVVRQVGSEPKAAAIALAGVGDPRFAAEMLAALEQRLPFPIRLMTDVEAALLATAPAGPAIVLISGTGSIAMARDVDGGRTRSGGHLTPTGDPGSASAIGHSWLEAARRGVRLAASTSAEWPREAPPAPLAEVVDRLAREGERLAHTILSAAAASLVSLVADLFGRVALGEGIVPVGLSGGVLERSEIVRRAVIEGIEAIDRRLDPRLLAVVPEVAAARSIA